MLTVICASVIVNTVMLSVIKSTFMLSVSKSTAILSVVMLIMLSPVARTIKILQA
jgi:hypothetical protein